MFKGHLPEILGFYLGEPFEIPETQSFRKHFAAPPPSGFHGERYHIFIHCDVVDHQVVGESYVPLLRCINV